MLFLVLVVVFSYLVCIVDDLFSLFLFYIIWVRCGILFFFMIFKKEREEVGVGEK